MTASIEQTQKQTLAEEFARLIRRDLSAAQLKKVNSTNAKTKDYCASHTFIDSNMTMAEAFHNIVKRAPDIGGDTPESQKDIGLWNEAWQIAVDASFFVTKEGK